MLFHSRPNRSLARWLFSTGAVVAMAAQLGVALSALADAREGSSTAAHVEVGGTARHYAHNDATCAACQARSIHSPAVRAAAPLAVAVPITAACVVAPARAATADLLSDNPSRAPPLDIRV